MPTFTQALQNVMNIQSRFLYRKNSRETSIAAALSVYPKLREVHVEVLEYAYDRGYDGFTDIEMNNALFLETSNFRSRRSELTIKGFILDSGIKRGHPERGNKRMHTVWIHKDFTDALNSVLSSVPMSETL